MGFVTGLLSRSTSALDMHNNAYCEKINRQSLAIFCAEIALLRGKLGSFDAKSDIVHYNSYRDAGRPDPAIRRPTPEFT
jgi:hypothetical protein